MALCGGIRDVKGFENSVEIESLGRFAIEEHNKKENAMLEFARVVKAQEQTVAGLMHYLTIEVVDGGKKKLCEAKVWVKAWENFKQLDEFKRVGDSSSDPESGVIYFPNSLKENGWIGGAAPRCFSHH